MGKQYLVKLPHNQCYTPLPFAVLGFFRITGNIEMTENRTAFATRSQPDEKLLIVDFALYIYLPQATYLVR